MENLTNGLALETLPKAFKCPTNEVRGIKRLLLEKSNEQPAQPEDWFDLNELCNYQPDKRSMPKVYGWVNACIIVVHKGVKKLRFLKSKIDSLKQGRKKTFSEIACEAKQYCKMKKG